MFSLTDARTLKQRRYPTLEAALNAASRRYPRARRCADDTQTTCYRRARDGRWHALAYINNTQAIPF